MIVNCVDLALETAPKVGEAAAARMAAAEAARQAGVKKGNDNRKELQRKLEQMMQKRKTG